MTASPPIRRLNPARQKLKRFLETRWVAGQVPITATELQDALGYDRATWGKEAREVRRWIALLGWKECSRKIDRSQPARKGFWPPLRPAPRVDEWSEYDEAA